MPVTDPEAAALLARIEDFGFDAAHDPLGFASRLADDQGWTLGYALAVTQEYRRFLVLTQVAGQAVSPSPDVDEAWHLHLTRTAHYDAFCRAAFGRFLHHAPARVGEGGRHRDLYRATLAAYRRAFGFSPPPVVWPLPDSAAEWSSPAASGWAVPHELRRGHRLAIVAVLLSFAAALLSRNLGMLDSLQGIGPVPFLGAALLATAALGWFGLRSGLPPVRSTARDVLEPYEAAWFSGGAARMAMTAIVALTERGALLAPGKPSERGARPPIPVDRSVVPRPVHPAEAVSLAAATDAGLRFADACAAMRPLADQVERRLIAAGVASDVAALPTNRARALLGMVMLLTIELERILHAIGTPHRIGFLTLSTLAGVALVTMLSQRLWRANPRSERVLRPLRLAAGRYRRTPRAGETLAFGVALIGGTVLADDLRFDGLKQQVGMIAAGAPTRRSRQDGDGGGTGCGSSCGSNCSGGDGGGSSGCGSSCGGGCGGGD